MFFSYMTEVNFISNLFVKWLLQNYTGYFKSQWCPGYQLSSSMRSDTSVVVEMFAANMLHTYLTTTTLKKYTASNFLSIVVVEKTQ